MARSPVVVVFKLLVLAALVSLLSSLPSASAALGYSNNLLRLNAKTFRKAVHGSDKLSLVAFTAPVRSLPPLPTSPPSAPTSLSLSRWLLSRSLARSLTFILRKWCGYCKKLAPDLDKVADSLKGIVNVGEPVCAPLVPPASH